MKKNQKGITLIALVITIIVLLILAGVSIAMLTGENGILTKSITASTETRNAEIKEALSLAASTIIADQIDPTIETATQMNYTTIAAQVLNDNASSKASAYSDSTDAEVGIYYTYGGKTYIVKFDFITGNGNTTFVGVDLSSVIITENV